jgi:hypothetical protein
MVTSIVEEPTTSIFSGQQVPLECSNHLWDNVMSPTSGGIKFLQNVSNNFDDHIMSYSRRSQYNTIKASHLKLSNGCNPCATIRYLIWGLRKVSYPSYRPWRPIGLWDVEAPTFSSQSAHRWWWDCQPYAPAALYPPRRFLVPISVRGWVNPRAIVRLEGLGQSENLVTSSGLKPAVTFQLVV